MSYVYNPDALQPIFRSWEEPNKHRKANPIPGGPAIVEPGRRVSRAHLVPQLRHEVEMWRRNEYAGASETSRMLLNYWFNTAHENDFRYHFCQQEAIETIIWLYEVAQYRDMSSMYASLLDENLPEYTIRLKSISPEDDAWARYCTKVATGGGKTKVMSLAIVWSYFHKMLEPNSDLAQHFVIIAPNLIVFERLKDAFQDREIFTVDPVIPPEWQNDFNLQVIFQEEAGGGTFTGTLYLTNIHRLYERERRKEKEDDTPSWAGPKVNRGQALKVGEALRKRIAEHPNIMVLNDEAHHLHDPDSAWNEALNALDKQSKERGNAGICTQLDFTATPKYNDGSLFRHIICDFPLGEAVDAGIVKVPVIGKSDELREQLGKDDAYDRWRIHLKLGYKQYEHAYEQWQETRKPILFVMTENTDAANEIANRLDTDEFPLLKGRVINLHTKLKGKIKKKKQGNKEIVYFEEDEKHMSDDDIKIVRQLSRDLDSDDSPYRCVVSVLMLREGWDVRNVTTIVPLRPYSADSNILAEQTLGRGLRRMTGHDGPPERVTVVEHEAFVKLYEQELEGEGLLIGTDVINGPKPESVSIFVDSKKPVQELEIEVPNISDAFQTLLTLEGLTFEEVRSNFQGRFKPLPIMEPKSVAINFEERALFTDELIGKWEIDRGLLQLGSTAISVFVRELEKACRLQSAHAALAPLIQRFIEEVLFEHPVSIYDGSVDHRMGDIDVIESIRATLAPLILKRTVKKTERQRIDKGFRLSGWKPYQATRTPTHPCVAANKTMFNLVPCNRDFETDFVDFCDIADDVTAFARNAGPQKLMIDYMGLNGRPALYTPDFFVRLTNGDNYLIETKGQEDSAVPLKACAAVEWCTSASKKGVKWQYVFIPMAIFEANTDFSMTSLARACEPRLIGLLDSLKKQQMELSFEQTPDEVRNERTDEALSQAGVQGLPEEIRNYINQSVNLLAYFRKQSNAQLGGAFQPMLVPFEQLCGDILKKYLKPRVPDNYADRGYYFEPYLDDEKPGVKNALSKNQRNLQKILVHGANCNRIGTFLFCIDYANSWDLDIGAIWKDVRSAFATPAVESLMPVIRDMNEFRNRHVAHVDEPLTDADKAEEALKQWIQGISQLYGLLNDGVGV